jgi:hypothetical protein
LLPNKKPKVIQHKPYIRTSGSDSDTLSREELDAILKEDEEDLKKENEKRAEDDFKIGRSNFMSLQADYF